MDRERHAIHNWDGTFEAISNGQTAMAGDLMSGVFGQSIKRLEDGPLLQGRGRYVDDIHLPGALEIAVVRSPYAHALIRSIDTQRALSMPGVHAVWMAADLEGRLRENLLRVALPSPAYRLELHRPVLPASEVVHVGEAVAIVVADNRYLAEDAAGAVDVHYQDLPAVGDCRAALDPDSPVAHTNAAHNLVAQFAFKYGDVDRAFAEAAHVFKEVLSQHRGVAHSMECRGVVANYDSLDERLVVWSSTQTPHAARRYLCEILGLDDHRVRVVTPDVGGGFGPKLVFYPEEVLVALAAMELRRPVKWIEDRREHFVATTQERDQVWDMEIAVEADGRIRALRGVLIHDHGAYSARGVNVPYGSAAASMSATTPI